MKIGVITFQYAYNYGAILQLASMLRILTQLGHEVEAINYLPPESKDLPPWKGWGLRKSGFIENAKNRIIRFRYGKSTENRFDSFKKNHLKISKPLLSESEVSQYVTNFDALVTGSDQVWHFDKQGIYFLNVGSSYNGKKISYAPSCGIINQPDDKRQLVKKWLEDFDSISVRDSISKEVIEKTCEKTVKVVSDPSLLVDISDLAIPTVVPERFIFMYVLGKEINGGHQNMINHIRLHYGELPVVALVASAHKPQSLDWADITLYDAGPGEWLYLIQNAEFVYTDSFHCSLFAIKNKKNFLSYYSEERRAPRLVDISNRYGVWRSVTGSIEEALKNEFWKQETAGLILDKVNEQVEISKNYLKESLK